MSTDTQKVQACRSALWRNGFSSSEQEQWSPDTLDALAEILAPVKHESTHQKGLFYWAEPIEIAPKEAPCFGVVAQADGFPPTEAHDDWFQLESAADEIAQQLAKGEL